MAETTRSEFEYALNAMEHAAQAKNPARAGYAAKRRVLFALVERLTSQAADAERRAGEMERSRAYAYSVLKWLDENAAGELRIQKLDEYFAVTRWRQKYVTCELSRSAYSVGAAIRAFITEDNAPLQRAPSTGGNQ